MAPFPGHKALIRAYFLITALLVTLVLTIAACDSTLDTTGSTGVKSQDVV